MLEIVDNFYIEDIDSAYWATKNRYGMFLDEESLLDIKSRVTKLFTDRAFLELIKDAKISKEQPISYNGELRQIDLFIEHKNHYIIIDYKSSDSIQTSHIAQVMEYKSAVAKITDKEVRAYICYIKSDKIDLVEVL